MITIKPKPETMKQEQRYNIFKRTHKGLRSMLFDAEAKIQQTDFTKNKQADAVIDVIKQSTRSFLYHLSTEDNLSLIHISEPTRLLSISYAVFCLKKKKTR